jgi:hypothetical protein
MAFTVMLENVVYDVSLKKTGTCPRTFAFKISEIVEKQSQIPVSYRDNPTLYNRIEKKALKQVS